MVEGEVAGAAAEPAGEGGFGGEPGQERGGAADEAEKDGLGDLGGGGGGFHLPEGGGIDEVGVAVDEFGEGSLDAVFGVIAEELGVGFGLHFNQ